MTNADAILDLCHPGRKRPRKAIVVAHYGLAITLEYNSAPWEDVNAAIRAKFGSRGLERIKGSAWKAIAQARIQNRIQDRKTGQDRPGTAIAFALAFALLVILAAALASAWAFIR